MCLGHAEAEAGSAALTQGREVLPTNVKPLHYDLTLEPDFEKFTYEGTVVIEYVGLRHQVLSNGPTFRPHGKR